MGKFEFKERASENVSGILINVTECCAGRRTMQSSVKSGFEVVQVSFVYLGQCQAPSRREMFGHKMRYARVDRCYRYSLDPCI